MSLLSSLPIPAQSLKKPPVYEIKDKKVYGDIRVYMLNEHRIVFGIHLARKCGYDENFTKFYEKLQKDGIPRPEKLGKERYDLCKKYDVKPDINKFGRATVFAYLKHLPDDISKYDRVLPNPKKDKEKKKKDDDTDPSDDEKDITKYDESESESEEEEEEEEKEVVVTVNNRKRKGSFFSNEKRPLIDILNQLYEQKDEDPLLERLFQDDTTHKLVSTLDIMTHSKDWINTCSFYGKIKKK